MIKKMECCLQVIISNGIGPTTFLCRPEPIGSDKNTKMECRAYNKYISM